MASSVICISSPIEETDGLKFEVGGGAPEGALLSLKDRFDTRSSGCCQSPITFTSARFGRRPSNSP
jgi:hypothetical protein